VSGAAASPPQKTCAACGRRIEWRKKWERDWEQVRYCSAACRRHGVTETDRQLEATIVALLSARKRGSTICPSDAARAVAAASPDGPQTAAGAEDWRSLMEPARRAARRLVAEGRVEITQRGQVVDPSTARGPIRIRFVG
jgi:hypothetical protein